MNKQNNVVLVISSDAQTRRYLRVGFKLHGGFSLQEANIASEGLRAATFDAPDLIICDVALPDLRGSVVLERVRSWSDVPIIILSTESNEMEKVRLFDLGADDYLVKPFGIAELIARCGAALRRYYNGPTTDHVVVAGPLSIDLARRTVSLNNNPIKLSPQQIHLLRLLAINLNIVVAHDELLQAIWGNTQRKNIRHLRVLFRELREKIEADPTHPRLLTTEWGVGYRLQSYQGVQATPAD
ncbi:response regulator [Bradyrhizobium sp.]|jgi:two-component system KDP operon response regulator KdpE|uniref:response regulator n=1 Tax=Bradyrhizobium sp. TaxID=376 RepID=UPI003C1C5082